MCEVNSVIFRPWNGESVEPDEIPRAPSVKSEPEEDDVSIISSVSEVHSRSESSSITSCEDAGSGSLDMLSNFVFNATQDEGHDGFTTDRSRSSVSSPSGSPSAFAPTFPGYPEYLASLRSDPAQFEAYQAQLFGYGLPIPIGHYSSMMEEAVNMIHQQDQQAKQMKKLRPKKFRCGYCNVAFSNNGQLKGHLRIHTGERPFKCDADNCGKSFTRNEELTRHKRIHTGLRPHSCLICGKKFGRKDHLKKHTRTHENRGPYQIPGLGAFAFGGHLAPHVIAPYAYPI